MPVFVISLTRPLLLMVGSVKRPLDAPNRGVNLENFAIGEGLVVL